MTTKQKWDKKERYSKSSTTSSFQQNFNHWTGWEKKNHLSEKVSYLRFNNCHINFRHLKPIWKVKSVDIGSSFVVQTVLAEVEFQISSPDNQIIHLRASASIKLLHQHFSNAHGPWKYLQWNTNLRTTTQNSNKLAKEQNGEQFSTFQIQSDSCKVKNKKSLCAANSIREINSWLLYATTKMRMTT